MIRVVNSVLMLVCVLSLVGVYLLKSHSETIAAEKAELTAAIEQQQADLSLLRADWAYLNQPGHIAPIIQRHQEELNLQVVKQTQFKSFEELPFRPVEAKPDDAAMTALFEAIALGEDPIAALIEAN